MSRLVLVLALLLSASNAFAQRLTVNFGAVPQPVYFATVPHIVCDSGCGSPPASADGTAFVAGTTSLSLIGGAFNDAMSDVVSGTYAAARITTQRAMHVNLRTSTGSEVDLSQIGVVNGGTALSTSVQGDSGGPQTIAASQDTGPNWGLNVHIQNAPLSVEFTNESINVAPLGGASFPVVQSIGSDLHMVCDSGCGTATSALQTTGNSSLSSIDGKLTNPLPVSLPAGFATSAIQATQQTALDAIKVDVDKIPSQGQALAASSLPVVLTAIQQAALTPPAAITGFALDTSLTTINTTLVAIQAVLQTPTPKLLWPCNALRRVNCR